MRLSLFDMAIIAVVAVGIIAIIRGAHGADWRLMRKLPGGDWQQRGPILDQEAACRTALASDGFVVPTGALLKCERVTATKEVTR